MFEDIRGEMRGRQRSESPRFRIGTPVILDLEDMSLGQSRGRPPTRTPPRTPTRPAWSPGTEKMRLSLLNVNLKTG